MQVEWLILQQNGACAICRTNKPGHVDHAHRTKIVRGIPCFNCNKGLGKFADRVELLHKAIDYLERDT